MTPYGVLDLGQHQAITWTNVDLSVGSNDIHQRAISIEVPQPVTKINLKITYSALPNKHNGTLIIFCKTGNAVRSLLGAVW